MTSEMAANSSGPRMGFGRRNFAPPVRQKSTVSGSSRSVRRMQGSSIPSALMRDTSLIPLTPHIRQAVARMPGPARNSSADEYRWASYPAEARRSPSDFKIRHSPSTTATMVRTVGEAKCNKRCFEQSTVGIGFQLKSSTLHFLVPLPRGKSLKVECGQSCLKKHTWQFLYPELSPE